LPRSSVPYARILHQRMLEPADGLRRATSVEQQVCSREPLERRSQLCFGPLRHWSDKLVAKFSAKKRSDFAISLAAAPSRSRRAISDACKVAGIASAGATAALSPRALRSSLAGVGAGALQA